MNYKITIESEFESMDVYVEDVDSVNYALAVLRRKYAYKEWRVVNIALSAET